MEGDGFQTQKLANPLDEYELGEVIGKGAVGAVYKGRDRVTGQWVAIKRMEIKSADELADCEREIGLMRDLGDSDHVVRYYRNYYWQKEVWVALELCAHGSITGLLDATTPRGFPESAIATVVRGVAQGLAFLHARSVIHRDIKPANCLISGDGMIKLADFGISKALEADGAHMQTLVGTPQFLSPEILKASEGPKGTGYGPKVDVWATGMCAIEMAEGAPPFAELSPLMVMYKLAEPGLSVGLKEADRWSKDFTTVVSACLQVDPEQRPSAADLCESPFCLAGAPTLDVPALLRQCRPDPRVDVEIVRSVSGSRSDPVSVHCGLQRSTGNEVSVKFVRCANQAERDALAAAVLAYSQWPAHGALIPHLDHYFLEPDDDQDAEDGAPKQARLVLIAEFCGRGSLADSLRRLRTTMGRTTDDQVSAVARALVAALGCLHALLPAQCHGAVSPAAVFYTYDNDVMLGDSVGRPATLAAATDDQLQFLAPDVLTQPPALVYSAPADVWAMGATLAAMANGRPLFHELADDRAALLAQIQQHSDAELTLASGAPADNQQQRPMLMADFVNRALRRHTDRRPTALELAGHPFIKGGGGSGDGNSGSSTGGSGKKAKKDRADRDKDKDKDRDKQRAKEAKKREKEKRKKAEKLQARERARTAGPSPSPSGSPTPSDARAGRRQTSASTHENKRAVAPLAASLMAEEKKASSRSRSASSLHAAAPGSNTDAGSRSSTGALSKSGRVSALPAHHSDRSENPLRRTSSPMSVLSSSRKMSSADMLAGASASATGDSIILSPRARNRLRSPSYSGSSGGSRHSGRPDPEEMHLRKLVVGISGEADDDGPVPPPPGVVSRNSGAGVGLRESAKQRVVMSSGRGDRSPRRSRSTTAGSSDGRPPPPPSVARRRRNSLNEPSPPSSPRVSLTSSASGATASSSSAAVVTSRPPPPPREPTALENDALRTALLREESKTALRSSSPPPPPSSSELDTPPPPPQHGVSSPSLGGSPALLANRSLTAGHLSSGNNSSVPASPVPGGAPLILQVDIPSAQATKKLRFGSEQTVNEAIEQITRQLQRSRLVDPDDNHTMWVLCSSLDPMSPLAGEATLTSPSVQLGTNDTVYFKRQDEISRTGGSRIRKVSVSAPFAVQHSTQPSTQLGSTSQSGGGGSGGSGAGTSVEPSEAQIRLMMISGELGTLHQRLREMPGDKKVMAVIEQLNEEMVQIKDRISAEAEVMAQQAAASSSAEQEPPSPPPPTAVSSGRRRASADGDESGGAAGEEKGEKNVLIKVPMVKAVKRVVWTDQTTVSGVMLVLKPWLARKNPATQHTKFGLFQKVAGGSGRELRRLAGSMRLGEAGVRHMDELLLREDDSAGSSSGSPPGAAMRDRRRSSGEDASSPGSGKLFDVFVAGRSWFYDDMDEQKASRTVRDLLSGSFIGFPAAAAQAASSGSHSSAGSSPASTARSVAQPMFRFAAVESDGAVRCATVMYLDGLFLSDDPRHVGVSAKQPLELMRSLRYAPASM